MPGTTDSTIRDGMTAAIGDTPLVRLRRASEATGKFVEAIEPEDGPSAALAVPVPEHSNAAAHNSTLPSKTR